LFHILPLGTDMDKVDATLARGISGAQENKPWDDAAQTKLHALVSGQPVLVQISAAKRLRDLAEGKARDKGEELVTVAQESAEPSLNESPVATANVMAPAPVSHPKAPSDAQRRGPMQPALFWTLGVLVLVALTTLKPWRLWDGPATDRRSDPQATLAPSPKVLSAPQTAQSAPVQRELIISAAPTEEIAFAPASAELSRPALKVSFPTATPACDWQHRDNSKTHTPDQPLKPGNYVYLEAQADSELCVLDSQNQKTMVQLKAGMATSVYGSAPFLVHSQDWQNLKLFFQGRRVVDALTDVQHLLLDSQPL
jgi:hypothetical protein